MARRELHYFDLHEYQLRAIEHIKNNPHCALWVDMGLGKTAITLTALQELRESFDIRRVLVIAPKRVARKTWTDEIATWSHLHGEFSVSKIVGTPDQRKAALSVDADIYLMGRDNVVWLKNLFIQGQNQIRRWPWDTVVLDESSSFKSQASQRTAAISSLRRYFDRTIELTGLPAPNGLHDIWSQLEILDRGSRLGNTITAFRQRWFTWNMYLNKWEIRPEAEAEIHERLGDICMSLRADDYLELPPILNNMIPVTMSHSERDKYDEMAKEYCLELKDKVITAVNGGVLVNKLLQLANGAVYEDGGTGRYEVIHNKKLEALEDLLQSLNPPIMIVYNFKHDLERMIKLFTKLKLNWRKLNTEQDEDDWNDGKIDYFLLHPGSGGHGLNLQFAESGDMVFFGHQYSLELYKQIIARLGGGHRRQRPLTLHHLYAERTMEEVAMAAIEHKDADNERLMNAVKVLIRGS